MKIYILSSCVDRQYWQGGLDINAPAVFRKRADAVKEMRQQFLDELGVFSMEDFDEIFERGDDRFVEASFCNTESAYVQGDDANYAWSITEVKI